MAECNTHSVKSAFSFWLDDKLKSYLPTLADDLNDQASADKGKSLKEIFSAASRAPRMPVLTAVISQS